MFVVGFVISFFEVVIVFVVIVVEIGIIGIYLMLVKLFYDLL